MVHDMLLQSQKSSFFTCLLLRKEVRCDFTAATARLRTLIKSRLTLAKQRFVSRLTTFFLNGRNYVKRRTIAELEAQISINECHARELLLDKTE